MAFELAGENMVCTACGAEMTVTAVAMHTHESKPAVVTGPWQAEADAQAAKVPVFTLKGETFRAVSEFSLGVQMDLAVAFEADSVPTASVVAMLNGMVAAEDEERFRKLLYSKTVHVDAEELRDALMAVIAQMGGRPFSSPLDSSPGHENTGRGSTASAP